MRRRRKTFPFKPILFILVLGLVGVMIFNSGVLIQLGILKNDIPESLGINPADPRVVEKENDQLDQAVFDEILDTAVRWITGRVKQGSVQIVAVDDQKAFPIAGIVFEIQDGKTGEVIETLVTDEKGQAISMPLNYRKGYKVRQLSAPTGYVYEETMIPIEMKAELMELTFKQKVESYVLDYAGQVDGTVFIKELKLEYPLLLQKPELPNGCEITAMTSLLNYYGYPVDKVTLSNDFLAKEPFFKKNGKIYGANPDVAFSGDPADAGGWFVYAPPTVLAAQTYVQSVSGQHRAVDLTGLTRAELMDYVSRGIPVGVWVTRDLSLGNFSYGWYFESDDTYFKAATNLHCMVIHGFIGDKLYVMDPLEGSMVYDKETFLKSFESMGNRAMIVEAISDEQ